MLDMLSAYTQVVVAGDFNVCFGMTAGNATTVVDLFMSYGFDHTINEPTRGENCLDNIFINFAKHNYKSAVIDCNLSDHHGQSISVVSASVPRPVCETKTVRPMTAAGFLDFFHFYSEFDFGYLSNDALGASDKYTIFQNELLTLFHSCFRERLFNHDKKMKTIYWFLRS